MEGGQKSNIDLTSGIDTQSNDMLVNVNNPKFLHNRQKMQGRYMPNSVRYEHDGWAVDNDIYEFEKDTVLINTYPKGYTVSRDIMSSEVPLYRFIVKDENGNKIGSCKYTPASTLFDSNGQLSIPVSNTLTAKVKFNKDTGKWELVEGANCEVESTRDSQYRYTITVINKEKTFNGSYKITKGTNLKLGQKEYNLKEQTAAGSKYGTSKVTIETNSTAITDIKVNGTSIKNSTSRAGTIGIKDKSELTLIPAEKNFLTHFEGIGSTEPLKLMGLDAHDKVIDDYISLAIVCEEGTVGSDGQVTWTEIEQSLLGYDTDGHKYRLRLDVAVPVWGGISFEKGIKRSTIGATQITTPEDLATEGDWKLQLKPGKMQSGYLRRYGSRVLLPNITVWKHCKDVTSDCTTTVISPMQLSVAYEYYKVELTDWIEDTSDKHEIYDALVEAYKDKDGEYYKTTEERVEDGSSSSGSSYHTVTHYWYKLPRPKKHTGSKTINNFDYWSWTVPDIQTLTSETGIPTTCTWTSNTSFVKEKGTNSNNTLKEDVDYDYADLGKIIKEAFYNASMGAWYSQKITAKLRSDSKDFDDDSYYHTDVTLNEGNWLANWCRGKDGEPTFQRETDNWFKYYGCLGDGSIRGFNSPNAYFPEDWKEGVLAMCYKGVFSKYLSLKNSVTSNPKQAKEFTAADFQIEDAPYGGAGTAYNISDLFSLEVGNIRFSTGNNCIGLNLVKKGEEPEFIFYCVKDASSSTDSNKTPKRWDYNETVQSLHDESRYAPGHIWNKTIDLAGSASGNMKAIAVLKTYGSSTAQNTITLSLDAIEPKEKKYITNVVVNKSSLSNFDSFETPDVDKHQTMLDATVFEKGSLSVSTAISNTTGAVTSTVTETEKIKAVPVEESLKDFGLEATIAADGDSITSITCTPSNVTDKSTFDVSYVGDKDTKKIAVNYVAYLTTELGQPYSIKKASDNSTVDTEVKDDIVTATLNTVKFGYSFTKGKVYLSFNKDEESLGNFELKQDEYILTGSANEKIVTVNTFEKGIKNGITVAKIYENDGLPNAEIRNDGDLLVFEKDKLYSVDLSEFDNSSQQDSLKYFYTRVNDGKEEQFYLGKQYTQKEYQFLKQQWNTTVDVENYWWLDQTHILELTKKEIRVLVRTNELDDWAADKWVVEKTYNRFDYITSNVLKYVVPNLYGTESLTQGGVFLTFEKKNTNSFAINLYEPLNNMTKVFTEVYINKIEIGEFLNGDKESLNSYSDILVENMLSQATFTASLVNGKLFVGIHYDNNFNQWTIVFDRALSERFVVQGYGYVGVNGLLTGGEIPKKYLSDKSEGYIGFNDKVEAISVLGTATEEDKVYIKDLSELSEITDRVVGTDSQQWYISKVITDIVSHIKVSVDNGAVTFTPEYIPITNNYSVNYASGSFGSTVLGDYNPQTRGLTEFIKGAKADGLDKFLSLALSPQVCYFCTKISTMTYLQQTIGQAAYVHYNSKSVHQSLDFANQDSSKNYVPKEAEINRATATGVSSDSIAFDYQSVKQKVQAGDDIYRNLLSLVGAAAISATDNVAMEKMKVNSTVNMSTANDYGKAFGTYFLANAEAAAISDFTGLDMNPKLNSEVAAMKTLDMFYSTSSGQEICAGSGWVNHNFVAQCTAQSTTSVQMEGRQQRYFLMISAITMIPIYALYKAMKCDEEIAETTADSTSGGANVFAGPAGAGTNVAEVALHYATTGVLAILKAAKEAYATVVELLPDLLKGLGADKLQTNISSMYTKHNVDIEASHKYGTKMEYFMYPCWNCAGNTYVDEIVDVGIKNKSWYLDMSTHTENAENEDTVAPDFVTNKPNEDMIEDLKGNVSYFIANIKGSSTEKPLPVGMASVEGVGTFLPTTLYKNENIGESEPVFTTPPFQDYIIDESWSLSRTASVGMTTWVSCKDTKLIDGEPSNFAISDDFCGVASPYAAIEVRRGIEMKYLRPFAITPKVLSLNCTGYNCLFDEKMYHAFDGYGYRIVSWRGESGLAKGNRAFQYSFLMNDRFKRSNKMPVNLFFGNFKSDPVIALEGTAEDKVFSLVTMPEENKGMTAGTIGEDKDARRYSIPVFTEYVSTMPAVVKTISSYNLSVVDGITTLTSENHDLQSAYKAPTSVDFSIGEDKYRYTQEYICSLQNSQETKGVTIVEHLCPCIGLTYLGATPTEALFYSRDNRQYYSYSGGKNIRLVSMLERFRNIISGRYDFINQEIIVPALANFKRLDDKVEDDADETDNVFILRMNGQEVQGEVTPPLDTIYKTKEIENFPSWFRTLSLPMGLTFQGPNRCIVNRFIVNEYMLQDIRNNYGKWKRVPKEEYHPFRKYKAKFESVEHFIGDEVKVEGWTHNPFLLVTAPLGVNEEQDCLFEWNITFVWTKEMDMLYNENEYAVVNLLAETMTVGGKVIANRPTHIYLTKELFTRTGNYGYYSFRYQSNCGAGNRERLHIWSDQYIAINNLTLEYKPLSQRHNDVLTQQVDISELVEV